MKLAGRDLLVTDAGGDGVLLEYPIRRHTIPYSLRRSTSSNNNSMGNRSIRTGLPRRRSSKAAGSSS